MKSTMANIIRDKRWLLPASRNIGQLVVATLLLATMVSCSSSKKSDSENPDEVPPAESASTDGVPQDNAEAKPAEAKAEEKKSEDSASTPSTTADSTTSTSTSSQSSPGDSSSSSASAPPPPPADASSSAAQSGTQPTDSSPGASSAATSDPSSPSSGVDSGVAVNPPSGPSESYSVRAGDSLMRIAFETYGDIYQWRKIWDLNRDRIKDPNRVPAGTVLKVEKPMNPVNVVGNGEKYLIRKGDTLGSIAQEVYGSKRQWKKIYENNRQLIKDPNKIYAGFYVYYLPEAGSPMQSKAPPLAVKTKDSGGMPTGSTAAMGGVSPSSRAPASTSSSQINPSASAGTK